MSVDISSGLVARNLIDGHVTGHGPRGEITNPAKLDEVVGEVIYSSAEDVSAAVTSAAHAGAAWARTPLARRCELVGAAAKLVAQAAVDASLPELLTREQGKILPESELDIALMSMLTEYCVAVAEEALAEQHLTDQAGTRILFRKPVGVVAAITPWNWPVVLSAAKIVPALICGNTMVLKPAPNTPLAVTAVVQAMASALPDGVLNLVHGAAEIGNILTSHPGVRKVAFTGSIATGADIMRAASSTIKNITLELGGNDAAIVLDDAVVDDQLGEALATAAFATSGQVCMAIKRLYVHQNRYTDVIESVAAALDRISVGDGRDPRSGMGPLNNRAQFDRVNALVSEARQAGASVHEYGAVLDHSGWNNGYFIRPTLVTGIDESARLVSEEQFGPALPIMPFAEERDAVERANGSEYGLSASVWSSDEDRAFALGRELEAGATYVNAHGLKAFDLSCPGGGMKQSGIGREFGLDGIRAYTETAYITNRRQ